MKKAFKLLGLCLVAITLSVNFSACGDEGEDDNNNGNTTTNHGAMSTSGKRIKSIMGDGEKYTFSFDAQGHIASYVLQYDDSDVTTASFTYGDNTIEVAYFENGVADGKSVYTLSNGLVSSLTAYEADGSVSYTESYQFQNNNFVGCTYTDEDGPYQTRFTWNNGNITEWNDGGYITAFTYNTDASRDRIELWLITNDYDPALMLQGYFGNGTQHRLNQVIPSFSEDEEEYMTLYYNYNADGDVSSLILMFMGDAESLSLEWE